MRVRRYISIVAATVAFMVASCVNDDESTLTVVNESSFIIEEVRIADQNDIFFGPDLTGRDALFPGEALDIVLDCDVYDIFLLDELDVECVLPEVDVCHGGTIFFITDRLLEFCDFVSKP